MGRKGLRGREGVVGPSADWRVTPEGTGFLDPGHGIFAGVPACPTSTRAVRLVRRNRCRSGGDRTVRGMHRFVQSRGPPPTPCARDIVCQPELPPFIQRIVNEPVNRRRPLRRAGIGLGALILFLVGLQFVKGGVAGLAPKLDVWLPVLIRDAPSALGAGWLAAYVLFNGSVVAAIGLTFYEAALVPASHLLLVIFGSRLGAAGIVLIVGLADLVHNRSLTVRRASEVGILTFLVTHTTGIPALLLAFALIGAGSLKADAAAEQAPSWAFPIPHPIEQAAEALVSWTGPIGALAAGVLLLLAALRLVNHVFVEADFDDLRTRYRRVLKSRWIAAGIGCALTTLTTSIAFSLGVVVPIYNRGFLRRREIIPYILGANVGTFVDTLAVSLFIERTGSLDVVLLATGSTVLVTLPVLLLFGPYRSAIERLTDAVMRRPRSFAVFLIALVAVPIGLLRIGAWIGS